MVPELGTPRQKTITQAVLLKLHCLEGYDGVVVSVQVARGSFGYFTLQGWVRYTRISRPTINEPGTSESHDPSAPKDIQTTLMYSMML